MILVTGATGNVGGELVAQLSQANQERTRFSSQSEQSVPRAADIVTGDLDRPSCLTAALKDVSGVFLRGGHRDMRGLLKEIRQAEWTRSFFCPLAQKLEGNQITPSWNCGLTLKLPFAHLEYRGPSYSPAASCRMHFAGVLPQSTVGDWYLYLTKALVPDLEPTRIGYAKIRR